MEAETKMRIVKEMTIGELVQKYPSIVEILTGEGVHCVGCGASVFESIQDGLSGHGKTQEQIDDCVRRMNEALALEMGDVQESTKEEPEVAFTEACATKVLEMLKKQNKEGFGLRVAVIPGGCSGQKYEFSFENEQQDNDSVYEVLGLKFYVDTNSRDMLKGSTVDYVESLQESGFRVQNPNATRGCGCGKSFA